MGKYDKFFLTETSIPEVRRKSEEKHPVMFKRVVWLDSNTIPGAFYTTCVWYLKPRFDFIKPHVHDFDEVLGFFGSDPEDVHCLGGEVELWVGGEKHIITKSCLVFIPKGIEHCPLSFNRVDRPIFHFSMGTGEKYISSIERIE